MLDAAQAARWTYVLGRNATNLSPGHRARLQPSQHLHHRPSGGCGKAVPGFLGGWPQPQHAGQAQCPPYPSTEVAKAYLDHICSFASK